MTGHAKKALVALAVVLVSVGLWAGHAAAPPEKEAAPAAKEKKQARPRDRDFRAALTKVVDYPGLDDPKATLPDALDLLAQKYGLYFEVNERAFRLEQYNDVLTAPIAEKNALSPMKRMPLVAVLKTILLTIPVPSGATFLIRRHSIEITTTNAVRREMRLPEPEGEEVRLEPPFNLLWEEIDDEPLAAVLVRIAEAADTTILLDPRAKEKAAAKVTAALRNVPLSDALDLLADMAGLVVVRRANAYYVTTAENAARMKQPAPSKKKAEAPAPEKE